LFLDLEMLAALLESADSVKLLADSLVNFLEDFLADFLEDFLADFLEDFLADFLEDFLAYSPLDSILLLVVMSASSVENDYSLQFLDLQTSQTMLLVVDDSPREMMYLRLYF
jgi:hypothetical protein